MYFSISILKYALQTGVQKCGFVSHGVKYTRWMKKVRNLLLKNWRNKIFYCEKFAVFLKQEICSVFEAKKLQCFWSKEFQKNNAYNVVIYGIHPDSVEINFGNACFVLAIMMRFIFCEVHVEQEFVYVSPFSDWWY